MGDAGARLSKSQWTVVVLVVAALVLSILYGTRRSPGVSTTSPSIKRLQVAAALPPCPQGLGTDFPEASLSCLGGGAAVALRAASSGIPMLVNVYGSWCEYCVAEMPFLRQATNAGSGRLAVVGIDSEDDLSYALHFAKDLHQTWPAIYDNDKEVATRFRLRDLPGTLFVDGSGHVVYVFRAAFTSEAQLSRLVRQHLGVQL